LQDVLSAIERHGVFIILGHEDPDGDCLGSQLALNSFLNRQDKECLLISKGPFRKPGAIEWANRFSQKIPSALKFDEGDTVLVLLDCSSPDRTGLDLSPFKGFPLMIIDHHASGSKGGNYRYIDSQSPSTTLLVQDLIEASSLEITQEEAEFIFFGFCTDTDFFRHLEDYHRGVFTKIESLMARGISPNKFYNKINSGQTLLSKKHLARVLNRTESHCNGKFFFTYELADDFKEMEEWERDSGTLYKQLQSIKGSQVICVAKESGDDELSVSFRSSSSIDVGQIAQRFDGGGHPKASGCLYRGCIDDFREEIIDVFTPLL
jgi:phosphoesterase RecJ-like protein